VKTTKSTPLSHNIHPDNFCVIMAGGIGSRFWPMSRSTFPKQFHDVLGLGQTLIQMTYERFLKICPPENILIVTNADYKDLVKSQLPDLTDEQLLLEPARRNTAACIAYANYKIAARNSNARIIVAPSDHLIMKEDAFIETVELAIDQCAESDSLITLGIKPSRPDTGYGYIQFTGDPETNIKRVKKVKTFTEKPNLELAKEFLASGDFYWNSGIFIWSLSSIQKAFETHLSEMNELFADIAEAYNTPKEAGQIANVYAVCENISIDYGILEKAEDVKVVLSDFGWSDLGTWGSLYTHLNKDDHGNGILGKQVILSDSSGNVVKAPDDKLVAIHGLDNHVVIDTGDILLICPLSEEQSIKQIVSDLKLNGRGNFV